MRGRYTDARRQLGGLTREVQRLARLLDEVPSQSELLQYERRFAELGEQVRSKMGRVSRWRANSWDAALRAGVTSRWLARDCTINPCRV